MISFVDKNTRDIWQEEEEEEEQEEEEEWMMMIEMRNSDRINQMQDNKIETQWVKDNI